MNRPNPKNYFSRGNTKPLTTLAIYCSDLEKYCDELEKENKQLKKEYLELNKNYVKDITFYEAMFEQNRKLVITVPKQLLMNEDKTFIYKTLCQGILLFVEERMNENE